MEAENKLEKLSFLIGAWTGDGESFGQTAAVEHRFEYILQNKFIQSRTRSVSRNSDGESTEIHEDMGVFSYDSDRDVVVLREFYTEGYVNTYLMEETETGFVFTTERTESAGGLMARLSFTVLSDDVFEETLELAGPGKEFSHCLRNVMKRVID